MATKKPMKKPVKRVRRFQEGGEAALKAEGLAASNKDAPLGFFESLRRLGQGSIDQEGSEAYNRYGAGRGRMERAAASEFPSNAGNGATTRALAPVSAKGISKYQESVDQDEMDRGADMRNYEMMQRGDAAGKVLDGADRYRGYTPIAKPAAAAQVAAIVAKKTPAAKPAAKTSKPATGSGGGRGAAVGEEAAYRASRAAAAPAATTAARPTTTGGATTREERVARVDQAFKPPSDEQIQKGLEAGTLGAGLSLKTLSGLAKNLANRRAATKNSLRLDRPGTVSGEGFVMRDGKIVKDIAKKAPQKALPSPVTDVTPKTAKQMAETNLRERGNKFLFADDAMKRGGKVKKMAHGGSVKSSVSTASKRGDGIALRGKTRGKIY
jgi:hypothetical protein